MPISHLHSDPSRCFFVDPLGTELRAICNYCQSNLSAKSSSGTNHLHRHPQRCRTYLSKNKQTLLELQPTSGSSNFLTWIFSQKASSEIVTKMIVAHKQPFTTVEYPLFCVLLASLQPKFQLPSRNTLKNSIIAMFNSMKEKLSKSLEDANSVALTTDLWTSTHQDPFMVVKAHYICSNWNLHKQVISFKPLPAPHTGIAIAKHLIKTMVDWKIIKKVSFITVDNASSNDVALARVSSVLREQTGHRVDLNGQYFHV